MLQRESFRPATRFACAMMWTVVAVLTMSRCRSQAARVGADASTLTPNQCDRWRGEEQPRPLVAASVQPLPIAAINASECQFSALAWFGEALVLVPERAVTCSEGTKSAKTVELSCAAPGTLFMLDKAELVAFIRARQSHGAAADALVPQASLRPRTEGLRLNLGQLCTAFHGYAVQGVEAIAFSSDRRDAWLLIESKRVGAQGEMVAWLAHGTVREGQILLDPKQVERILPNTKLDNLSAEAITVFEQDVFILEEANGPAGNGGAARAHRRAPQGALVSVPMPPLCYRVTDATQPDAQGRFWVTNVLCKPGPCEVLEALPPDHPEGIEQLVQLRIDARSRSIVAGDAPIVRLSRGTSSSNWEGIAQLDALGFLIIADKFSNQGRVFGYVPYPQGGVTTQFP